MRLAAKILLFSIQFVMCLAASSLNNGSKPNEKVAIELAPVRLVLAMPKERAIVLLAEYYDVSPWKGAGSDTWGIAEKAGHHVLVGSVTFKNDSLVRATRMWDQKGTDFSVTHTLANLLGHLKEEGFTDCITSARKESQPKVERDVLVIDCGLKGIVIEADQQLVGDQNLESVTILETLEGKVQHSKPK